MPTFPVAWVRSTASGLVGVVLVGLAADRDVAKVVWASVDDHDTTVQLVDASFDLVKAASALPLLSRNSGAMSPSWLPWSCPSCFRCPSADTNHSDGSAAGSAWQPSPLAGSSLAWMWKPWNELTAVASGGT